MTPALRRLWLYGLALLLPALGVGAFALGLLARERARVAERERAAGATRVAAVEARARLIAENIELLVGDVQAALMTTLEEAPVEDPARFLAEWQAGNPLVRDVFRATADGRPTWGATSEALRAWLGESAPWVTRSSAGNDAAVAIGPTKARAQVPTSSRETSAGSGDFVLPAPAAAPKAKQALAETSIADAANALSADDLENRRSVSSNVQQYRGVRMELQAVAQQKGVSVSLAPSSAAPAATFAETAALAPATSLNDATVGTSQAPAGPTTPTPLAVAPTPAAFAAKQAPSKERALASARAQAFSAAPAHGAPSPPGDLASTDAAEVSASFGAVAPSANSLTASINFAPLRHGWAAWRTGDTWRLFGWRELPDRSVIGLELRMEAIKSRLGEVFPTVLEAGEAYALRDAGGLRWHAAGPEGLPEVVTVPLGTDTLPGWTVAGQAAELAGAGGSVGVFVLGASVVGLLVLAITGAGALLLRQARRSELEALQKTSFVANVSHELKTPLTTIRLYAELLAQGRVREDEKRAEYLLTIGRETERLSRLVGRVLDFSRLEQGKRRFARERLDLAAELRRLAETHAPRLAEARLRLETAAPESLLIETDRDALEQIVLNLLDNACKYAAEGGELRLELAAPAAPGGAARLTVADRGPGVPAAQRERIFEKFHRLDDRLTAEKSGAGLGLSIARQLARGLGGELVCRGREGGGAEFVLTLPAQVSPET